MTGETGPFTVGFFGALGVLAALVVVYMAAGLVTGEDRWRDFQTPAGPIECYGSSDSLSVYSLADECVQVQR